MNISPIKIQPNSGDWPIRRLLIGGRAVVQVRQIVNVKSYRIPDTGWNVIAFHAQE
jgi:hypothetical protein